ncbi:MAG: hypothetical protein PSW75_12390 [bacterium]|nr:hypothetical protein [bacterium]
MKPAPYSQKGSLILLVMCLLAVLGIALAGYLAVSTSSMKLSNRSVQAGLSTKLAEMGLEEALRAFNSNNWATWTNGGTTATWTLSGTTATCNLTFPSTKFGLGVTGSVKVRVDNYNARQLDSTWSSSANYRVNDLVGYSGTWYRCVQNHTNQPPNGWANTAYWVATPISWTWSSNITYAPYDAVNYNGVWYRYINSTSTSGNAVSNSSYWASVPLITLSWSSTPNYPFGAVVYYSGAWYYSYQRAGSGTATPTNTGFWMQMVDSSGAESTSGSSTYTASGTEPFYVGDYIYKGGVGWYRCIAAQPYLYVSGDYADTTKWVSSKPFLSLFYRSAATYAFNDRVYYNGTWYRGIVASATGVAPANGATWEFARSGSMFGWNSANINYNLGDVVYYSSTGLWYRCIYAHTSSGSYTPNSATYPYWSTAPLFSTAWDSGKQYSQYDTVQYNGVWYLSLLSSNIAQNPVTATTYWIGANTSTASYQWNATTAYSAGNYRCYGGVWYNCLSPYGSVAQQHDVLDRLLGQLIWHHHRRPGGLRRRLGHLARQHCHDQDPVARNPDDCPAFSERHRGYDQSEHCWCRHGGQLRFHHRSFLLYSRLFGRARCLRYHQPGRDRDQHPREGLRRGAFRVHQPLCSHVDLRWIGRVDGKRLKRPGSHPRQPQPLYSGA